MDNQHLERLRQESLKPNVRDLWEKGFVEGLDPSQDNDMAIYQKDPVGFAKDVLGVNLTPAQKELLEAVRDFEIVQVKSATGVGKTFGLGVLAVWVYKCFDWAQVYTAAAPPESNLRRLLWGEIFTIARDQDELFAQDSVRASLHISRHPKQFITGVTIPKDASEEDIETKWSGKHSPILFFIFDEGDGIPDPVYRGADGCMSGGTFVRQVVCYNPKKRQGMAYRRERAARAHIIKMSALDHPNVLTGEDVIPGAVSRNKTLLRIYEWTEPKPIDKEIDGTCWQIPSFLVGLQARKENGELTPPLRPGWRVIVDNQFYYKVMGDYPAGGVDRLLADEWIDDAVARWEMMRAANDGEPLPPRGIRPTMGLDVSAGGPDFHCAAFRYGTWWEVPTIWKDDDPSAAAEKAAEHYADRGARLCKVDATGVGAGSAGVMVRQSRELNHHIKAVPILVGEKSRGFSDESDKAAFALIRDEAYWMLRVVFRKGDVALPPENHNEACKRLHEALRLITYDRDNKGRLKIMDKKTMRKRLGFSPDELESYVMTYAPENVTIGGI
jgi:hypothetical protein